MIVKTKKELEALRAGGKILAQILSQLKKEIRPGISTDFLSQKAKALMKDFGVQPSFLGYKNFPAPICISLNEEIVHGLPSKERKIKQGDLISLDLGIWHQGFCTDAALTLGVGSISPLAKQLLEATKEALRAGIQMARVGNTLGDIGYAIQKTINDRNFFVIKELAGHGVGKAVHEPPLVLNYGRAGEGQKLIEGMVLAIEPMAALGLPEIEKTKDGFGYKTKSNALSAHFEHTIVVTASSPEILTLVE